MGKYSLPVLAFGRCFLDAYRKERQMLTQTERNNIVHFAKLHPQHQYMLRYRLKKKCIKTLLDLEFLLLHCKELKLKPEGIVQVSALKRLLEAYEGAAYTESVKISK